MIHHVIWFVINLIRITIYTSIFTFLLHNYLKYKHPIKYTETIIMISFKLIFMISSAQIKYQQLKNYIYSNPTLKICLDACNNTYIHKNTDDSNIDFILNGKIIDTTKLNKLSQHDLYDTNNYDFMIYTDYKNTENNRYNKKIINGLTIDKYTYLCDTTNFKFMLCQLKIGEKSYKIDLMTEHYNYYLVDNVLNKNFMIYYLLNHYPEDIKLSDINLNEKFILSIIDHEVNCCEIDITDRFSYVLFKKDNMVSSKIETPPSIDEVD